MKTANMGKQGHNYTYQCRMLEICSPHIMPNVDFVHCKHEVYVLYYSYSLFTDTTLEFFFHTTIASTVLVYLYKSCYILFRDISVILTMFDMIYVSNGFFTILHLVCHINYLLFCVIISCCSEKIGHIK